MSDTKQPERWYRVQSWASPARAEKPWVVELRADSAADAIQAAQGRPGFGDPETAVAQRIQRPKNAQPAAPAADDGPDRPDEGEAP